MDSRDPHRALPDGMACTVCDEPVPAERIQPLAHREDMTFIRIECAACGSTTLGFVAGAETTATDASADRATGDPDPISADDVLAMHEFLATWQGEPRALLGRPAAGRESRGTRPAPPR